MVMVLVITPLFVFVAQQNQQTKSKASASTTLAFEPISSAVKVGEILTLNVILDPGKSTSSPNLVSFVKLVINFDPRKFTAENTCLTENTVANTLTTKLEGPICEPGKASISLSIGADPAKVVTEVTKIAVLQLKALSPTEGNNPSSITFDISNNNTQVLSIASTDKTSENVLNLLSTSTPASITINPAPSAPGASPTPTPTPTPATAPSASAGSAPAAPQTGDAVVNAGTPEAIAPTAAPEIIALAPQPPPTEIVLPPTGPEENILGIGAIGIILTIIGSALFMLL